jgi:carboxyl-terminal processing protease
MRAAGARPVFVIPLVFLLGIFVSRLPSTIAQLVGFGADFFAPISEVQRMLDESYVTESDAAAMQKGAIDGMLESLNDPYAQYIPPVDRADFDKELLGRFCGIGAQVQIDGGLPTIVTPLEDSPAFRAGIIAGDKITEVDGQPTAGLTIDQVVSKLTGEPDTKVSLKVRRGGEMLDFALLRKEIVVRAVQGVSRAPDGAWDFMLDREQGIGYIRLSQFIPTAPDELTRALQALGANDGRLKGLILDLRNNPGGDLVACLDIADMFLRDGAIVSVRGRTGANESYNATAPGTLPDFPLVVLVNGFSASASEIVAGSLADHGRATVVGTRTFGKGLVQTVRPLESLRGAQVKYTVQRYELPSGRVIQRSDTSPTWGVDPTPGFYVPLSEEEELASQLKRREFDVLRVTNGAAPAGEGPRWGDPAWIEGELKDKQLAGAVRAIGTRIGSGKWNPLGDATQQASMVSSDELRRLERTHQRMLRAIVQLEERMNAIDSAVAGTTPASRTPDLWPDDLDLTSGAVEIFDKSGRKVADLRITGPELERWLLLADVEAATPAGETPGTESTPEAKKNP